MIKTSIIAWLDMRYSKKSESEKYMNFEIRFIPSRNGSFYQLYVRISATVKENTKSFDLIRADYFRTIAEAQKVSHERARRLIDEKGFELFE